MQMPLGGDEGVARGKIDQDVSVNSLNDMLKGPSENRSEEEDFEELGDLGSITASMVGTLRPADTASEKDAYRAHLEDKYR